MITPTEVSLFWTKNRLKGQTFFALFFANCGIFQVKKEQIHMTWACFVVGEKRGLEKSTLDDSQL